MLGFRPLIPLPKDFIPKRGHHTPYDVQSRRGFENGAVALGLNAEDFSDSVRAPCLRVMFLLEVAGISHECGVLQVLRCLGVARQ